MKKPTLLQIAKVSECIEGITGETTIPILDKVIVDGEINAEEMRKATSLLCLMFSKKTQPFKELMSTLIDDFSDDTPYDVVEREFYNFFLTLPLILLESISTFLREKVLLSTMAMFQKSENVERLAGLE